MTNEIPDCDHSNKKTSSCTPLDYDAPLPLPELKSWVSKETYHWLEIADQKAAELAKELEDNAVSSAVNLFNDDDSSDDEVVDMGDGETSKFRVHQWSSSPTNPDGIFHTTSSSSIITTTTITREKEQHVEVEEGSVHVEYLLSDSLAGFGDTVWASSRHISNLLANPETCRALLRRLHHNPRDTSNTTDNVEEKRNESQHPLVGRSFLELGAGAAIPSLIAMKCGARVVCTDQPAADRFRCIAECMERNWRNDRSRLNASTKDTKDDPILKYRMMCRTCPYGWGTPPDDVLLALDKDKLEKFDVIVGADCVYMPWLHDELLQSIDMLLSEGGMAFLPFALHGNTDDDDVLRVADRAREKGFVVDELEVAQLTPQGKGMDAKQGLVYTVQLTRN